MKSNLSRRLVAAAALFTACLSGCHSASTSTAANPSDSPTTAGARPNIVVILADDLGYADIGVQNEEKDLVTPNIDSIAKNGVRFTSGYVSCPVCSPSRAGFLTGRYQERFGHEFNPGPADRDLFGLPKDQITIANVLHGAGYATGMTGKWHEGSRPDQLPTQRGFDEFFGFPGGAHKYINLDRSAKNNEIMRGDSGHPEHPVSEPEYLTDAISREAAAFIDRHHDAPFFLYVPYNAVHTPQQAPPKYLNRFPSVKDHERQYMLAMLSAEDDGVGKILAALRQHNLERNTLVFFFSDNGGPTQSNGSRNKPLSGFKGQVWEGGIRIPFMAQWSGKIPPGQVIDFPVISLDIYPTAAAAAGAKLPSDRPLDGRDLMPLMTGKSTTPPHEQLYWRFSPAWAIRDGKYKIVHYPGADRLCDLSTDIGEKHDLSKEKPELFAKLHAEFDAWNKQMHDPIWGQKARFNRSMPNDANQLPHNGAAIPGEDD